MRTTLSAILIFALSLLPISRALHFYLDSSEQKCFLEELPVDTIVEGQPSFPLTARRSLPV